MARRTQHSTGKAKEEAKMFACFQDDMQEIFQLGSEALFIANLDNLGDQ